MNHKNARIIKLWRRGLTVAQIIQQLGYSIPDLPLHQVEEVKRRVEQTILKAQSEGD